MAVQHLTLLRLLFEIKVQNDLPPGHRCVNIRDQKTKAERNVQLKFTLKKTSCLESASELYRPSDPRLSAKLVPTFADRGVSHGQCGGSPTAVISVF
jgi:hypothetical protein